MKRIALILCLLLIVSVAQKKFVLTGSIAKLHTPAKMFIYYPTSVGQRIESAVVNNGTFKFEGKLHNVVKAHVKLVPFSFFLELIKYTDDR